MTILVCLGARLQERIEKWMETDGIKPNSTIAGAIAYKLLHEFNHDDLEDLLETTYQDNHYFAFHFTNNISVIKEKEGVIEDFERTSQDGYIFESTKQFPIRVLGNIEFGEYFHREVEDVLQIIVKTYADFDCNQEQVFIIEENHEYLEKERVVKIIGYIPNFS